MKTTMIIVMCPVVILVPRLGWAEIRLPSVFSDHMVLQRDTPVNLWGWAEPDEQVVVEFADQKHSVITDREGRWQATLHSMPASAEGRDLVAHCGKSEVVTLRDVVVGDVWVSCGQSNMMFGLAGADTGEQAIADSGDYPGLRLFNVAGDPRATQVAEDVQGDWRGSSPTSARSFSAVSYFFGRHLHMHLGVPIGMINVVAIVPAEAWVDPQTLAGDSLLKPLFDDALQVAGKSYQGMIAPLQPFTIRGVIYYQGEYNSGRARQWRRLFPALVRSWRSTWGQGEFPFLAVQLPAFYRHVKKKDARLDMPLAQIVQLHRPGAEEHWAEFRDAQLSAWRTVPNTGLAIAIDLGDPNDIHPSNKQPVGDRLALQARNVAYGEKITASGPVFRELETNGRELILKFDHVGTALRNSGEKLTGFELAGRGQRWVWADARIEGETVIVAAEEIEQPVYVRYAWANYPRHSLFNAEGLPASPFRASVRHRAFQQDRFIIPMANASCEEAFEGDGSGLNPGQAAARWILKNGARRSSDRAAHGNWCVALPENGFLGINRIVPGRPDRYDWNSDLLSAHRLRPGTVVGYSVEIAAGGDLQTGYMNLCCDSTAGGYQHWGDGIPLVTTAKTDFVSRRIATRLKPEFRLPMGRGGLGIGGRWINQSKNPGTLYLDNFSDLEVIRPKLRVSDVSPIDLGTVAADTLAVSQAREISNAQSETLTSLLGDDDESSPVATVLYGINHVAVGLHGGQPHAWDETDHVGAEIIGSAAERFAFVTEHPGGNARQLCLMGTDGKPGLTGGMHPEPEPLQVQFLGAKAKGMYLATVRIVTQAGNTGIRSDGRPGEPISNLFYVDIPVKVLVSD